MHSEQTTTPSAGEGVSSEPARQRFPWRALVLGVLLLPPLTLFGHLAYVIVQSARWTADTLLRGPIVLLFLLSMTSLLCRRFLPRLAPRLALTRSELLLVYVMATVGTALAGESWAVHIVPALLGTATYQAEMARPEWAPWTVPGRASVPSPSPSTRG